MADRQTAVVRVIVDCHCHTADARSVAGQRRGYRHRTHRAGQLVGLSARRRFAESAHLMAVRTAVCPSFAACFPARCRSGQPVVCLCRAWCHSYGEKSRDFLGCLQVRAWASCPDPGYWCSQYVLPCISPCVSVRTNAVEDSKHLDSSCELRRCNGISGDFLDVC